MVLVTTVPFELSSRFLKTPQCYMSSFFKYSILFHTFQVSFCMFQVDFEKLLCCHVEYGAPL